MKRMELYFLIFNAQEGHCSDLIFTLCLMRLE